MNFMRVILHKFMALSDTYKIQIILMKKKVVWPEERGWADATLRTWVLSMVLHYRSFSLTAKASELWPSQQCDEVTNHQNSFQFCIFWSPQCLKNLSSIVDFLPWLCNICNVSSKVHPKQNKLKQTKYKKRWLILNTNKTKANMNSVVAFCSMKQNWPSDFLCLQCGSEHFDTYELLQQHPNWFWHPGLIR